MSINLRPQPPMHKIMDRYAVKPDFAFAGRVETSQQPEESALAAAAGAHNGDKLPSRNVQRNSLQNVDAPCAILNPLFRVLYLNQCELLSNDSL